MEKLVRDRVPEFFKSEHAEYRVADESEMIGLLTKKLAEEVDEFTEAAGSSNRDALIEELADVCEIVMQLRLRVGAHAVADKLALKAAERGGFEKRIVLQLQPAVPMFLRCPKCNGQHVDRGIWATTRVHRTHLCEHCGHTWKPFDYATVGVESAT